jgi:hypothetical protein
MKLCLRANSNIISMNSLNTIIVNAIEKFKFGEVGFDKHDIFLSPKHGGENLYMYAILHG